MDPVRALTCPAQVVGWQNAVQACAWLTVLLLSYVCLHCLFVAHNCVVLSHSWHVCSLYTLLFGVFWCMVCAVGDGTCLQQRVTTLMSAVVKLGQHFWMHHVCQCGATIVQCET